MSATNAALSLGSWFALKASFGLTHGLDLETVEAKAALNPRIESLSDLIFGLALSIGAISLTFNPPTTVPGLFDDILTFAFSFIILISVWIRYTRIMSSLPLESRKTMLLNTLLMFTVSIEPFLFNIFRSGNSATPVSPLLQMASTLYGVDLGVMMLVMGIFTVALTDAERKLVPKEMRKKLRNEAVTWLVSAAVFLISALPFFNGVYLEGILVRTDLWLAALAVVFVRRRVGKLKAAPGAHPH
jgi:uncharacterized membrane protein